MKKTKKKSKKTKFIDESVKIVNDMTVVANSSVAPFYPERYRYRAKVIKVVDGDTVRMQVDLGFDTFVNCTMRLAHINAPEMSTEEGQMSKSNLEMLLIAAARNGWVEIRTLKDRKEKYGRYLVEVYGNDGWVHDRMIATGHAVGYEGGKR